MKTNLIAFFADLFNVLEIHPAKCVSFNQGRNELADGKLTIFFLRMQFFCFVDVKLEHIFSKFILCL